MKQKVLAVALVVLACGVSFAASDKKAPAKKEKAPAVVAVEVPPPSGTWEGAPPPAEGYVWSAGYYEWKDGRYQWAKGEWVLIKPGMEYRQHKWVQRADGKWVLTGGDWVRRDDDNDRKS
jgi:hypothetical protein